ncbi:uncharacterized protein LOC134844513 [Symsagittifera roscoffensis]|uniref:uncharacterized protein LOC134844513 n=1 Tax=Symsagittifera roscoffensis TaxID=84072 RepID=UPI00307B5BFB
MASVAYNGSMYSLISGEEDDGMLGEGCVEPDMSAEEVVRLLLSPVDYENEYEHHRYNLLSDLLNGLQPDDVVSEEWVMQFVDNEGIQILLAKLLEISKRYDKEDMTIFATLVPLSSVLRSLIGYQAFLQFFIARASDPEVIGVTAKVMMSNSLMCRREVVHLLTNMMIEESSSVQFVTKVYSLINRTSLNTFPFQPLVEDFGLHMGDIEYLAELLAFINAFILCEGHYEGRMKQREAFIKAGLIDIFESDDFQAVVTNSTKNIGETSAAEALKIQLDFFEQQMADDETLALEPLQTILMQLLNSEISTETKIILNNFQQISETYADGQSDFLKLFFQTLVQLSQDFARCDNPEELIARINKGSSGNKITASANEKGANVETEEKKENDDEVTSNKKSASRMSLLVNLLSDAINDEDAKKELNRQQNEEQMDPVFPNQDISRRIKELRSPMFRTRHSFIGGDSKSIFSDLVTTLQCNYSDSAEGLSEDDIRNRAASLSRLWELRMRRGTESSEIRDQV